MTNYINIILKFVTHYPPGTKNRKPENAICTLFAGSVSIASGTGIPFHTEKTKTDLLQIFLEKRFKIIRPDLDHPGTRWINTIRMIELTGMRLIEIGEKGGTEHTYNLTSKGMETE